MEAEYRGLGFDPAPGSPDVVAAASDRLGRAAGYAASAAPVIETAGTGGAGGAGRAWEGTASTSFATALARAPAELGRAHEVLRTAAGLLDDWTSTVRDNQARADRLDRQALQLRRALEQADDDVAAARTSVQVAIGSAARTAAAELDAAIARHARLQQDLDKVLEAARVLERDHLAAAQRTAERLRVLGGDGAEVAGELPRDAFDRLARTVGGFSTQAGELAMTLLGGGRVTSVPSGGAARLASALASAPGQR